MSPEDKSAQEAIYNFLQDTTEIYGYCKRYSILIEEILPTHKAPIHAANEMKALVFHLYNIVQFPGDIETNIVEAKEHLCRAFYDLHSLVISIYIESIKEKLAPYKLSTISNAFPEYGNTIRPSIKEIQKSLMELRADRNTDIEKIKKNIPRFEKQVVSLAAFDDIIESMKPAMNEYEAKKSKKTIVITVLIIIISMIMFGIGYFIGGK